MPLWLYLAALVVPTNPKDVERGTKREFDATVFSTSQLPSYPVLQTNEALRLGIEHAGPSSSTERKTPQARYGSKLPTEIPHPFDLKVRFVPNNGINIELSPEQVKIKESVQKQTFELEAFHSTQSKMQGLERSHSSLLCTECNKPFNRLRHLKNHLEPTSRSMKEPSFHVD